MTLASGSGLIWLCDSCTCTYFVVDNKIKLITSSKPLSVVSKCGRIKSTSDQPSGTPLRTTNYF